jgi:hypothetical protein
VKSTGSARPYVYFEDETRRRAAAKLLTGDEARRIAANIAKAGGGSGHPTRSDGRAVSSIDARPQ